MGGNFAGGLAVFVPKRRLKERQFYEALTLLRTRLATIIFFQKERSVEMEAVEYFVCE